MSIAEVRLTDPCPDAFTAPRPAWVRGVCASCHGPVVSNLYWVRGRHEQRLECWAKLLGQECEASEVEA